MLSVPRCCDAQAVHLLQQRLQVLHQVGVHNCATRPFASLLAHPVRRQQVVKLLNCLCPHYTGMAAPATSPATATSTREATGPTPRSPQQASRPPPTWACPGLGRPGPATVTSTPSASGWRGAGHCSGGSAAPAAVSCCSVVCVHLGCHEAGPDLGPSPYRRRIPINLACDRSPPPAPSPPRPPFPPRPPNCERAFHTPRYHDNRCVCKALEMQCHSCAFAFESVITLPPIAAARHPRQQRLILLRRQRHQLLHGAP
jgi:hypothetical protein